MSEERIDALLREAVPRLKAAGLDAPMREARLLLAEAAGLAATTVMAWPERLVDAATAARFRALTERRLGREPLSRILGRREFWSLDFALTPATLDPRPDSETVIEAALERVADRAAPLVIADFGTGTGCLLLALLSCLPHAWGLGIDRSPEAARVAQGNAARLGLDRRSAFLVGDWAEALVAPFDIILSNPPYIPTADLAGLLPEVRLFDPALALDGGPDGLGPYRILAVAAKRLLRPGGFAVFEFGAGQAPDVAVILSKHGLVPVETRRDIATIERAIVATAP